MGAQGLISSSTSDTENILCLSWLDFGFMMRYLLVDFFYLEDNSFFLPKYNGIFADIWISANIPKYTKNTKVKQINIFLIYNLFLYMNNLF